MATQGVPSKSHIIFDVRGQLGEVRIAASSAPTSARVPAHLGVMDDSAGNVRFGGLRQAIWHISGLSAWSG